MTVRRNALISMALALCQTCVPMSCVSPRHHSRLTLVRRSRHTQPTRHSLEIDAAVCSSPSPPFAGDRYRRLWPTQTRRPPQARPQTLMCPWACWWHMRVWLKPSSRARSSTAPSSASLSKAPPKCPRLQSTLKCQIEPLIPPRKY